MAEKRDRFNLIPRIIDGGIAGIIGVTCVFPIDLVKTRLQSQRKRPDGTYMYKSILDCFRKTLKSEGLFGMYRGSAVNILLITPEKAIKLVANDDFRFHLREPDHTLPLYKAMIAGGMAGFCQVIVTNPMELLKIQLQNQGRIMAETGGAGPQRHKTSRELTMEMIREKGGILKLYEGTRATLLRDVLFSMIYFPLFAILDDLGPRKEDSDQARFWWSFLSGLTSGCIGSFVVTPCDVVKTRLQALTLLKGEKRYTGIIHTFKDTLEHEGVKALFKGGLCRIMVMAPLFGIVQAVYYLNIGEEILFRAGLYPTK